MNSHQISVPPLTKVNKILIITVVALFILGSIAGNMGLNLTALLGLKGSSFFSGHVYQLFTYSLITQSLMEVVFESLIIWFIGSELEGMWGQNRYLKYLLAVSIGGGLIYLIISLLFFSGSPVYAFPLTGLAGVASAQCLSYAIIYPNRLFTFMFIFPMKAKYFCLLIGAMSLYSGVFTPFGAGAWGHLGSMASAWGFMVYVSRAHMSGAGRVNKVNKKIMKKKSHLTLVQDDDEKPPKYWQ